MQFYKFSYGKDSLYLPAYGDNTEIELLYGYAFLENITGRIYDTDSYAETPLSWLKICEAHFSSVCKEV
jgi:hypothetical protein